METLTRSFLKMVVFNLLMLLIVSFFYAESFSLAKDPLSWLGRLETDEKANTKAFLLFTATLLFDAFQWRSTFSLRHHFPATWRPLFSTYSWLVFVGFLLMAFPCDRFNKLHCLGAGLVIGGFWALTAGLLYLTRAQLKKSTYLSLHLILHASAIFCAFSFLYDTFLKGFSQRALLIAIIAEMSLCLRMLFSKESSGLDLSWQSKGL